MVKSCRNYTLKDITPKRIVLTSDITYKEKIEKELGCKIEIGPKSMLVFHAEATSTPIITHSKFIAESVDKEVDRRIKETRSIASITDKIIRRILASGDVSANRISRELALSKRSFERRLNNEGTCFRNLLDKVKSELAIEYLNSECYSITEISFMLGFKESNSFFRAFKRWHNTTPLKFKDSYKQSS